MSTEIIIPETDLQLYTKIYEPTDNDYIHICQYDDEPDIIRIHKSVIPKLIKALKQLS